MARLWHCHNPSYQCNYIKLFYELLDLIPNGQSLLKIIKLYFKATAYSEYQFVLNPSNYNLLPSLI